MKIRHRQSGVELEDHFVRSKVCARAEERPRDGFMNQSGSFYAYTEWELVKPEPVWEDVTKDCFWHMNNLIHSDQQGLRALLTHAPGQNIVDGYRLRKVHRWDGPDGCAVAVDAPYAFIIERKQP